MPACAPRREPTRLPKSIQGRPFSFMSDVQQSEELISIGAALAREAARQGQAIAVECEGDVRSWEDLHRRTNRIARGLAAKGVGEGDFLTIALPNSVGFVEACYAAWKLGAVPQPVSYRLPAGELRAIVELAK